MAQHTATTSELYRLVNQKDELNEKYLDGRHSGPNQHTNWQDLRNTNQLLSDDMYNKERRLRELNRKCQTLTDIFSDYDTIILDDIVHTHGDHPHVVEEKLRSMKKIVDQRDNEIHKLTYDIKRLQQEGDKLRSELNNYNSWYNSHCEADRTAFAHMEHQKQTMKEEVEQKNHVIQGIMVLTGENYEYLRD